MGGGREGQVEGSGCGPAGPLGPDVLWRMQPPPGPRSKPCRARRCAARAAARKACCGGRVGGPHAGLQACMRASRGSGGRTVAILRGADPLALHPGVAIPEGRSVWRAKGGARGNKVIQSITCCARSAQPLGFCPVRRLRAAASCASRSSRRRWRLQRRGPGPAGLPLCSSAPLPCQDRELAPPPLLAMRAPRGAPRAHRSVMLLGNSRRVRSLPSPRSTMGLRQFRMPLMTYVPAAARPARGEHTLGRTR